jgi:cytochrome c-type biogenesis protein CcmH
MKINNFHLLAFFLLLLASALMPAATASAQQPTPSDDQVNAIARQLYCPVCENTPLDVCPTTACHQWRELIRQMLSEGRTETEIKQYFVDYYGARVLSEPPRTGINWLIYIVPPVAFLAGAFLLFRAFQTWKKMGKEPAIGADRFPPQGSEPDHGDMPSTTADDEYIARLEKELKERV